MIDLRELLAYSVANFGEDVARRYKADVDAVLRLLARYPLAGSIEPLIGGDIRSYPVGEHRVYYRIIDRSISVGRILHKRMDVARRF